MRNKVILSLLPVFFFMFTSQAAIFIPEVNNSHAQTISTIYDDAPAAKSKGAKKSKKTRGEKIGKVDSLAKWGFISSIAGFLSIFLLPVITFALFPLAIGLSIAGLNSTRKNNTRGKGLAIAGLSIGSAGVLLLLFGLILVLTIFSNWTTV